MEKEVTKPNYTIQMNEEYTKRFLVLKTRQSRKSIKKFQRTQVFCQKLASVILPD